MSEEAPRPPKINLVSKRAQREVELVLHNYQLRLAIGRFRKKWRGVKMNDLRSWENADEEIQEMLKLFDPPLPKHWVDILHDYAHYDHVAPKVQFNSKWPEEWPAFDSLEKLSEDERINLLSQRFHDTIGFMGWTEAPILVNSRDDEVEIKIFRKLSKEQWQQIADAGQKLTKHLPKQMSHTAANIPQLSKIADLRREKKSYRQIAGILSGDGHSIPEPNLRVMAGRAKALNL